MPRFPNFSLAFLLDNLVGSQMMKADPDTITLYSDELVEQPYIHFSFPSDQPRVRNLEKFLSSSVFYPCSRFDGTPVKYLSKYFSNFVYVDYNVTAYDFIKESLEACYRGYKLSAYQSINFIELFNDTKAKIYTKYENFYSKLGLYWMPLKSKPVLLKYSRLPEFSKSHGPKSFKVLFIQWEAVTAYSELFCRRGIAPQCLAHINPGMCFGGNYSSYPSLLSEEMMKNPAGLPPYLLVDKYGMKRNCYDYLKIVRYYYKDSSWHYLLPSRGKSYIYFLVSNPCQNKIQMKKRKINMKQTKSTKSSNPQQTIVESINI